MKTTRILTVLLGLLIGTASFASAATNEVMVVMNGQTQVNRETYKFLMRNLNDLNLGVKLSSTLNPSTVKAGTYKAVVVFNTSVGSGVDPVLKAFIDNYPDKKEIFLVSLYQGGKATPLQDQSKAGAPGGVDGVAAASWWSEGGDKMTAIKYHQNWIKILANFVKAR